MQAPDITAGRGGLSALHNAAQYSHAATQAGNAATVSALQATKSIYDLWNTRREIGRQREQDKQASERHDIEMEAARYKLDFAKKNEQKQFDTNLALTRAQTGQTQANTRDTHANAAQGEISNKQNVYEMVDLMLLRDMQENGGKPTKATLTAAQQMYDKAGLTAYDKNKRPINTAHTRFAELSTIENKATYLANLQNRHNPTQTAQAPHTPQQDFLSPSALISNATPPSSQVNRAFGASDESKSPMARK